MIRCEARLERDIPLPLWFRLAASDLFTDRSIWIEAKLNFLRESIGIIL